MTKTNEQHEDPLYDQAVEYVKAQGRAGPSMLQRKIRIAYNRAMRMLDRMEREGIIEKGDKTPYKVVDS